MATKCQPRVFSVVGFGTLAVGEDHVPFSEPVLLQAMMAFSYKLYQVSSYLYVLSKFRVCARVVGMCTYVD